MALRDMFRSKEDVAEEFAENILQYSPAYKQASSPEEVQSILDSKRSYIEDHYTKSQIVDALDKNYRR